jgi:hypothetical protein
VEGFTVRRLALLTMAALLASGSADAAAPPAPVRPPVLTFRGATKARFHRLRMVRLTFEVRNPNAAPLRYLGWRLRGGLAQGRITPAYEVELRRGGTWQPYPQAAVRLVPGQVELAAGARATFEAWAPACDWAEARAGLLWFRGSEGAYAWSQPVPRKLVEGRR